jgi:nitroreductase
VVTTKITPGDPETEQDDLKSVSCAIQNFMLSMWSEGVGTKWTSGPVQKTQAFADICQVDTAVEKVVGCIWYGYASGGAKYADPRRRKNTVEDVLTQLP